MSDIFNMGGVFKISSESRNETMDFGAYNGSMNIRIWRNGGGQNGTTVRVSAEYYTCIRDAINDTMKGVPGAAFPIITLKWDPNTKKKDIQNTLIIGKDTNGIFYVEFKEPDFAPLKFPLLGNKNLDFGGVTDDASRSSRMFKAFATFVNQQWPISTYFTRNNLVKPGQKGNGVGGGYGTSPAQSSISASEDNDNIY